MDNSEMIAKLDPYVKEVCPSKLLAISFPISAVFSFCFSALIWDEKGYRWFGSYTDLKKVAVEFYKKRFEELKKEYGLEEKEKEIITHIKRIPKWKNLNDEELVKEADDELKLSILMTKLNSDVSTVFRQVACYKFEQDLHKDFREKGYLSKEEIGSLFQKNMAAYMGDAVEQSESSQNWWVYWSHIRNFFYVYSYASGLLISKSLQKSVRENPKFVHEVKEVLSTGAADSPKNIFKKCGIDITDKTFWNKGISEVEELLDETEKLAKKLGKV